MFIIWGFGRQTTKDFGTVNDQQCQNCNNVVAYRILKIRTWFSLFFIPIIPYRTEYFVQCPICSAAIKLTKSQFEDLTQNGVNPANNSYTPAPAAASDTKYHDKTPTQINYLKQMEQYEKDKNSQG